MNFNISLIHMPFDLKVTGRSGNNLRDRTMTWENQFKYFYG